MFSVPIQFCMDRFERWRIGEEEYLKKYEQVEEKNILFDDEDEELQDEVKAEDAKR